MFAIIKTGGKQYRVAQDSVIRVEKIDQEAGSTVTLDHILMIGGAQVKIGAPTVAGASVEATVMDQIRNKKIIVFKKKRRHNYRRKKGHRQHMTVLKINKIVVGK